MKIITKNGLFEYQAVNPKDLSNRKNKNHFFFKRTIWIDDAHLGEMLAWIIANKVGFEACDVELYKKQFLFNSKFDRGILSYVEKSENDNFINPYFLIKNYLKSINSNSKFERGIYDIDTIQKIDYYIIDNRYLAKQKTIDKVNGKVLGIMSEVYDGETCDIYYENFAELENPEDKKIVLKNVESFIPKYGYQSDIRNEGIIDFVINCAFSDIDTVKCNGRETYRFKNLFRHSSNIMETFIDKETGITVRNIGDWIMVGDKEYNKMIEGYIEFNTVTENDLRVQDSDDYTVQN